MPGARVSNDKVQCKFPEKAKWQPFRSFWKSLVSKSKITIRLTVHQTSSIRPSVSVCLLKCIPCALPSSLFIPSWLEFPGKDLLMTLHWSLKMLASTSDLWLYLRPATRPSNLTTYTVISCWTCLGETNILSIQTGIVIHCPAISRKETN